MLIFESLRGRKHINIFLKASPWLDLRSNCLRAQLYKLCHSNLNFTNVGIFEKGHAYFIRDDLSILYDNIPNGNICDLVTTCGENDVGFPYFLYILYDCYYYYCYDYISCPKSFLFLKSILLQRMWYNTITQVNWTMGSL